MGYPIPLLILILAGAPLFTVIAASALIGFSLEDIDLSVVDIEIYRLTEMPILLAIPFFTFAGYLLGESKSPQRLVDLTNLLLGWLPGGLAIVAIITCAILTAFTGASGITIVALGSLLYPALKKAGYKESFNLGLITSSGSLGLLFAPALPLILYGIVAQQVSIDQPVSIDDLFLAGLLPCTLMLILLSLWSMMQKRDETLQPKHEFSMHKALHVLKDARWDIPLPFIILGGIYGGLFAVSEAAVITALYVLITKVVIQREIAFKKLPAIVRESMVLVGAILIILSVSLASTNLIIDTELPTRIFDAVQTHIDSRWTFLLLLNLFLLAIGMMLDIFSALVILVPILLPIAMAYNIHPIHFGIIFLANMQLGYFTPPVGMNLFIASHRFNKPVLELYRATLPFFFILLLAVLLITYWPALSLTLIE